MGEYGVVVGARVVLGTGEPLRHRLQHAAVAAAAVADLLDAGAASYCTMNTMQSSWNYLKVC